ncbi:DEAD/DEAH box helicase [Myxococcus stipitatus DSM 14675]|uniref:DEAD/DEAH box helicase n=1 Tax=Myxococcus stipitatus (strain DSM 14675 / JCM 12634 / Mx s8) TaxID=1278073 RepID=L7U5Z6_MYXSD|nr:DEAD/DEAH box helicase [Myxococcus stipitatus]AGC43280.1 DEAD/DEAH box helicase [Myxococcus stipitatus DSM 14675]
MPAQTLREYQRTGIRQILDAYKQGARSVLAVSPTGSGKTTLFAHLAAQLDAGGKRSLILAHRRELVEQASTRLREFDVRHGLILAGTPPSPGARVQVASVQTLTRRALPPADIVIPDEAHLSTAATWTRILEGYPHARILGVTATPWRLAGKPLAGAYDAVVVVATPRELREQRHLSDYVGFSYLAPDLSGVETVGGDYNEAQSAAAMSQSLIVDNIVEEWLKHSARLSTVVFAVTVEHSRQLVERFRSAGVSAEHLDGTTPLTQREGIMRRVASGQTRVLSNVGVCIEGLDIPRLKCCVLARPTKSLARAIQMMGRVRRPWREDGRKVDAEHPSVVARIHDHAFIIRQHGLPDQDRDYSLHAKREAPPSLSTCPQCLAMYDGARCPSCGTEKEPEPLGERVIQTVAEAEQYEFTSATEAAPDAEPARPDKPPVKVRWDTLGRKVEGVLIRKWQEDAPWGGKQWHYLLRGPKRDYDVPGAAQLDKQMAKVAAGVLVWITYTHDTPLPDSKVRREFKVEVDDGEPEPQGECYCATTPRPPCGVCTP